MSDRNYCNCPDCSFFSVQYPHYCGLPGRKITEKDDVRRAVTECHCQNPALLALYVKLGVGR